MIEFVDRVSKIAADLVNGDNTVESVNISYPDTDTAIVILYKYDLLSKG